MSLNITGIDILSPSYGRLKDKNSIKSQNDILLSMTELSSNAD